MKGYPDVLSELLSSLNQAPQSFEDSTSTVDDDSAGSEAKKWRKNETSLTPEGMEGLQWEDEILTQSLKNNGQKAENTNENDDEWSVLFRYYANMIEKTGAMLANTITSREPHCLDAFRNAPIHYAAMAGSIECMKMLLLAGAPVNMTTDSGFTALHFAAHQPRLVELLLQHKASPNKLTFFDQLAPIHIAARIGNTETVSYLTKETHIE